MVRGLAKTLRSGQNRQLLQARQIEIPPLDVPTRWNSTYLMISSFTKHREFYRFLAGIDISEDMWTFMDEFSKSFYPVFVCTKELQSNEICTGDFVTSWIKLKMNLEKVVTNMARELIDCMELRQPKLIQNSVVQAALFIDPRFNYDGPCSPYLTDDGKNDAEVH